MSARPRRPLTDADFERLAEFRYILRRFLIFSEDAAHRAGLTAQQHQALLAIKGLGRAKPMTTGDLAERLGIRHHSAVGLIDRLVKQELVLREAAANDRRRVYVKLAPAGAEILERLSGVHKQELKQMAQEVSRLLQSLNA